ncbi:MAG: flavin reductase family protein [Proteobacteria bacterium]|nr:flavin reductase family protein [Pseudomonadota bacterium]
MKDDTPKYRVYDLEDGKSRRALRDCLGNFATGVAVITTLGDEGRAVGLTVNSLTSLSLDPPLVLWCLDRQSECTELFAPGHHFAVNILGAGQELLARRFSNEAKDRFKDVPVLDGTGGSPLIKGAVSILECTVTAVEDGGDHLIIVGRVRRCHDHQGPALMFHKGSFKATD